MVSKTVYLKSFGCQMNDADSEQILGILSQSGYKPTNFPEQADLILLNTCAIREKAEQKVFSDLGRFRALKIKDPSVKIGVAGCVAQSMGKNILSREPAVDFVLGTRSMSELTDLLLRAESGKKGVATTPSEDDESARSASLRSSSVHANVPIIYGCENFCSYCVVPYVRGEERSRPVQGILREVTELAGRGYKEVTLLGQNVNSYGVKNKENNDFPYLLNLLSEVVGIERIRFVTSHPKDLSIKMIEKIAELPKVCEALHLPVQSGSDRILEAMNRGYTTSVYLEKLKLLRERIPGIAVTTDIIVGFPGETDRDFEETLALIGEADFDRLFGFCFSPRPGTPAAGFPGAVEEDTAGRRLDALFDLQKGISLRKNQELAGESVEVLVEETNKKDPRKLTGRTRTNKIVHFIGGSELIGELVQVRVEQGLPNCLLGTLISCGA
jgi:tRNA-2-methylthio-N6-dimethylallyladenosine synthase